MQLAQIRDFSGEEIVEGIPTIRGFERVFSNVVYVLLGLAGIALFIMLVIGGVKLLTSAGDPKQKESASKTISSAVLGLVLVALAYLIIVIISGFTGVDLTIFKITQ
jgi:hypothetical protein